MSDSSTDKFRPVINKPSGVPGEDDAMSAEQVQVHTAEVVKLKQNFNSLSMLATCVSLMATWEAFCSTMASGLVSGGPVSLVYGYLGT